MSEAVNLTARFQTLFTFYNQRWIKIPAIIDKCWYVYPEMQTANQKRVEAARHVFRRSGGILRTKDAIDSGVHPRTLYAMRDAGILERLDRGLYRLAELSPLSDPDLVTVASKIPKGVICLISALHFHDMTTQIPHKVDVAVARGSEPPRLEYPPIHLYWFSGPAFTAGIKTHQIDRTTLRVYSPEKTLADCFKYRNKIGMDTVLEALSLYSDKHKPKPRRLVEYAKVCRVEKIMRPYLESHL